MKAAEAAADREGEAGLLRAHGFVPQRCLVCNCPDLIEPRIGVMDTSDRCSERAAIWECRECYAERRMPWPMQRVELKR